MHLPALPRLDGVGTHIHGKAGTAFPLIVGGDRDGVAVHIGGDAAQIKFPVGHAHIDKVDHVSAGVVIENKDDIPARLCRPR